MYGDLLDMHQSVNIIMIFTDALVSSTRRPSRNHQVDSIVATVQREPYYVS